jgi:hypothetical protein
MDLAFQPRPTELVAALGRLASHSRIPSRFHQRHARSLFAESFLHAYSVINCREITGTGQTDYFLSWMVLSSGHSLPKQHPYLFF